MKKADLAMLQDVNITDAADAVAKLKKELSSLVPTASNADYTLLNTISNIQGRPHDK
jgi:hypothetical protein